LINIQFCYMALVLHMHFVHWHLLLPVVPRHDQLKVVVLHLLARSRSSRLPGMPRYDHRQTLAQRVNLNSRPRLPKVANRDQLQAVAPLFDQLELQAVVLGTRIQ
jgi:hypothetical protein